MDIVDGLRLVAGAPTDRLDCFNCHSRMREAADEITRLRAELEASETELRIVRASQAESNAEVERLRADIERHIAIASEHATECERLRAELAVARAELAVSVGHLSRLAEAYGCDDFTSAIDAALAAKGE